MPIARRLSLVGALSVLACGCSVAAGESGESTGAGGDSTSSSVGTAGNLSSDETQSPLPPGEACGADATVGVEAGHRLASAMYVASALEGGTRPDPSVLRAEDFQAYFAPAVGRTAGAYGRYVPTFGAAPGADLELATVTAAPDKPTPLSLIVIVDESSSMREELELAADLLDTMTGPASAALGAVDEDRLTVVEWRDEVETLVAAEPLASPDAVGASAKVRAHAKEQLAGGPVVVALGDAVDAAIAKSQGMPTHIVFLTDGGFALDDGAQGEIARWKRMATASVIELHVVTEGPLPCRGPLLDAFSGGVQGYVGVVNGVRPSFVAPIFGARFGEMFRVQEHAMQVGLRSSDFSLPSLGASSNTSDAGEVDHTDWVGDGGTWFIRHQATLCGPLPSGALTVEVAAVDRSDTVTARRFGSNPATVPGTLELARASRMDLVDRVVELVGGTCPAETDLVTNLGKDLDLGLSQTQLVGPDLEENQAALLEMQTWLTAFKNLCP